MKFIKRYITIYIALATLPSYAQNFTVSYKLVLRTQNTTCEILPDGGTAPIGHPSIGDSQNASNFLVKVTEKNI